MNNFVLTLIRGLLICALLSSSPATFAADLREVAVEQDGNRYLLKSSTWFAVDQASLFAVIIDYDHFVDMSSVFIESRNLEPAEDGKPRFYNLMQGCVFIFCKEFERYGRLTITEPDEVIAMIEPEHSAFRYSRERWRFRAEGGGTLMEYEFEMEPGFWVPPIIGPYLVRRKLLSSGTEAIGRIEAMAQRKAAER